LDQVVAEQIAPELFHLFGFGEKPVASDIEAKAFVEDRSGDPSHVFRIRFEHGRLPPSLA
jgi:hypothetical protein